MGSVNKTQKFCTLIRKGYLVRLAFFNRHKMLFETGSLQTTFSNIFYFLPSTTDRSEEINKYLGSVNLSPADVPVSFFETKENVLFDLSKLDFASQEKEIMTGAVVKMLKKYC